MAQRLATSLQAAARVRYAPSPTGFLHVGGLRTALFNYLVARQTGGTFVLRIEDTDRSRLVPGSADSLLASLRWASMPPDEGPDVGGAYGPYVQSERTPVYLEHAQHLLDTGAAYRCFCTAERLASLRQELQRRKLPILYDRACARVSQQDAATRAAAGEAHTVRLRMPVDQDALPVQDAVRGVSAFNCRLIDDQVLVKSDGYPTYHLASVVDDHLMQISHVIRGEEWFSSLPKHVVLYQAFQWDLPVFAHLPLLLNPDRSKLSKRQGDVSVDVYRDRGILPEALVNFVALLGWNPKTEDELFSMDELVSAFRLDHVNRGGAVFDQTKLEWMNTQHLRRMIDATPDVMVQRLRTWLAPSANAVATDAYLAQVLATVSQRIHSLPEVAELCGYFFHAPGPAAATPANKRDLVAGILRDLQQVEPWSATGIADALALHARSAGLKPGLVMSSVRHAVTGTKVGAGVPATLATLGRTEVLHRLHQSLLSTVQEPASSS